MMFDSAAPIRLRQENDIQALKARLHRHLIETIDEDRADIDAWSPEQLRAYLETQIARFITDNKIAVNRSETQDLVASMVDELSGLGPIQPLVDDDEVNDILVNGRDRVFVERKGKLELTDIRFNDDRARSADHPAHHRAAGPADRRIVSDGRCAAARREPRQRGDPAGRARRAGALDPQVPQGAAARRRPARLRHVRRRDAEAARRRPCGALQHHRLRRHRRRQDDALNVLSQHIPEGERLVTIEDAAELSLGHPHVVRLETRPPNLEGTGEVAARDLVKNALRMRPVRIIVGEVRGEEVIDMLQAMNTGHEGSMTTIHANSARDAITRVEMLVGMSGFKGSDATLRHNIASAIDLVIQVSRLANGKRKVVSVTELTGVADGVYMTQDLFNWDFDHEEFRSAGVDAEPLRPAARAGPAADREGRALHWLACSCSRSSPRCSRWRGRRSIR